MLQIEWAAANARLEVRAGAIKQAASDIAAFDARIAVLKVQMPPPPHVPSLAPTPPPQPPPAKK